MANEISVNLQLTYSNVNAAQTFYPGSINITQTAQGLHAPIVVLTTAPTTISFGSLTTPGYVVGRNLDTSKYVLCGPTTTSTGDYYPFLKIKATEPFAFRLNASLWKWKCSSGTCNLQLQVYED